MKIPTYSSSAPNDSSHAARSQTVWNDIVNNSYYDYEHDYATKRYCTAVEQA